MESTETDTAPIRLPANVQETFERSSSFLKRKYTGVAPSPEELVIFYLSGIEPHEIVVNLERQVLQVSGKSLPSHDDHLMQTYLEMDKDGELST